MSKPETDVVILTEARYENPAQVDWYVENLLYEDNLLRGELEQLGLLVQRVDWAQRDFDWSRAKAAVFRSTWDYFHRFAKLPEGSRPLANPLGGAPGFQLANVWVLPGLPAEMEAMFDSVAEEFRHSEPIASWRRSYRTTESRIVRVLEQAVERHPEVLVGSYPSFDERGSEVEVVLKSRDAGAVAAAADWVDGEISSLAG